MARIDAAVAAEWHLIRHVPPFESFNVAPTQPVPIVRTVSRGNELSRIRWGLIPFFARGIAPSYSTINARMETVRTAASFRGPWKRQQRCAIIASGFYEWQLQADGRSKRPFYIHLNDQPSFAFAGLWDSSAPADGGEPIESCVMITLPANRLLSQIHNTKQRMPAILAPQDRDAWLRGSPEQAWNVLKPYPDELMVAWPVSTAVNKPVNDDVSLVEPV